MKLSERQVRIVNAFLRDAALETPEDPPTARTEVLTHIRRRLRDELARRNDSPLHDEDLIRLLNRIQLPDKAAHADELLDQRFRQIALTSDDVPPTRTRNGFQIIETNNIAVFEPIHRRIPEEPIDEEEEFFPPPLPEGPLASSQRVWLGVCTAIADDVGIAPGPVRALVGALGLLTGPIAVTLYLIAYGYYYLVRYGDSAPRVQVSRVLRSVAEMVVALVTMVMLFAGAVWLVGWVYKLVIGYPPEPDKWSQFALGANQFVFWGAILMAPFSVLAGLPVAPPWDWSIPRMIRLGLIALGILLSLAFASHLTGALLSAIRQWPA